MKVSIELGRDEAGDLQISFPNGESLRFDSVENNPNGVSFVRFYDNEGDEVVGWSCDEWGEDPEGVMGAIFGKLVEQLKNTEGGNL